MIIYCLYKHEVCVFKIGAPASPKNPRPRTPSVVYMLRLMGLGQKSREYRILTDNRFYN